MRLAFISAGGASNATRENRCVDGRGGVLDDGGGCRSRARPRASADPRDDVRRAENPEHQHAHDEPWTGDEVGDDNEAGDDNKTADKKTADDNQVRVPRAVDARLVT